MKNEIEVLDEQTDFDGVQELVDAKRTELAEALCATAEVYMTDLSWEDDAEQRCERLITEAVAVCPETLSAGVLQTLASIRISQERVEEAKKVSGIGSVGVYANLSVILSSCLFLVPLISVLILTDSHSPVAQGHASDGVLLYWSPTTSYACI